MKKLIIYISPLLIACFSCSSFYTSNSLNVPLIKRYNESAFSANVGTNGLDLQAATAIDHHLSVMGNFSYSTSGRDSLTGDHHQHLMAELAVGHFGHITVETTYEVFAGYGRGYYQSYNQFDFFGPFNTLGRGQFNRFFIQGNFGKQVDNIEFGGALKSSYFNLFEIKSQDVIIQESYNSIFLEPVIFARLDLYKLYLTAQLGYSYDLAGNFQLSHQPFIFSVGILYKLKRYYY